MPIFSLLYIKEYTHRIKQYVIQDCFIRKSKNSSSKRAHAMCIIKKMKWNTHSRGMREEFKGFYFIQILHVFIITTECTYTSCLCTCNTLEVWWLWFSLNIDTTKALAVTKNKPWDVSSGFWIISYNKIIIITIMLINHVKCSILIFWTTRWSLVHYSYESSILHWDLRKNEEQNAARSKVYKWSNTIKPGETKNKKSQQTW